MKRVLILICLVTAGFLIYSCTKKNDSTPVEETIILPEFPAYNAELHGKIDEMTEEASSREEHQNCCECEANGCSAKKCCSGGQDCSCTCSTTWAGTSTCKCSACTIATAYFEMWLEPEQHAIWNEFAEILETENSSVSAQAMGYHLEALDAIIDNNASKYEIAKNDLGNTLSSLQSDTKILINNFFDTYEFDDERL